MTRRLYIFDEPERFVAGSVGQPGQRTFFLQARRPGSIVSVALEKIQVAALADRMATLVAEVGRRTGVEIVETVAPTDSSPLDEPLVEAFRVGTLTLGWEAGTSSILVEARAILEDAEEDEEGDEDEAAADEIADDDPDGPDLVRVRLTLPEARAFAARAMQIVAAGRPPCPLCGQPLNPEGHICPRRNGYLH